MATYDPEKNYVVTGAYVVARTYTPDGIRMVGLYAGAPWPQDAPQDAGQHHLSSGLIAEVGVPQEVETPPFVAPTEPVNPEAATVPAAESADDREAYRRQAAGSEDDTRARAEEIQNSSSVSEPARVSAPKSSRSKG